MNDAGIYQQPGLTGSAHHEKKKVFFLHSGGSQQPHQGSSDLVSYLQQDLGNSYEVLFPKMPQPENPKYASWKAQLDKEFAAIQDNIILIGHSLGGSVLLKYLSEQPFDKTVAGLFIVAAPYWGEDNWEMKEYTLEPNFADALPPVSCIFFYHSRNDEVVPFSHSVLYTERLPAAVLRMFADRGHLFVKGLPELAEDIRNYSLFP